MTAQELHGIVLAPYGTLFPPALATYSQIQKTYERTFPGSPIRLAFTSHLMRRKLLEKEGISIPSIQSALEELCDEGLRSVIVQSLQIVPGGEFHQVVALVMDLKNRDPAFSRLEIGLPLLSSLADCQKVSSLIPALCCRGAYHPGPEKEAVLLVGHGTGHGADALYSLMYQVVREEHENVFIGTIEGFCGIDCLLPDLSGFGARVVQLSPFLLVAGGHAENDIFGPSPESWKSTLEKAGYKVVVDRRGLGDRAEMVSLFLEHTRNALERCNFT
ncbi:MAG: sirohydrochlorin cobaltochelatase [Methanothrix sp.]|nr:sirohydrochlorin cobaltochelatase [Methanothrix sp.]